MIDGLPWWTIPGVAALLFLLLAAVVLVAMNLGRAALEFLDGKEWR